MHSNERTAGRRISRALLALAFACASWQAHAGKPYRYYAVGDPAAPVSVKAPASRSYVMMGGGLEVDEAFRWMIKQAGVTRFSGGRFLVIRATGDDAYNQYLFSTTCPYSTCVDGASLGLTSVETLVIPSRDAANHDDVMPSSAAPTCSGSREATRATTSTSGRALASTRRSSGCSNAMSRSAD